MNLYIAIWLAWSCPTLSPASRWPVLAPALCSHKLEWAGAEDPLAAAGLVKGHQISVVLRQEGRRIRAKQITRVERVGVEK